MMPRTFEHGVPETVHLTDKNFDEVLVATKGLVMATEIARDHPGFAYPFNSFGRHHSASRCRHRSE